MSDRRSNDRRNSGPDRRSRDGLVIGLTVICLLCLAATILVSTTTLINRQDINEVQDGRKVGTVTVCAFQKAIIDAGRDVILSGTLLPGDKISETGRFMPGPLSKSLGPEYPNYDERQQAAKAAADRYQKKIVDQVVATAREQGIKKLPVKDSHLDCQAFRKSTGT